MNIPRIVIAGTNSGCGKTTITTGIMAALIKRGLKVQPFKVGPDYIDPMFHTFITGRDSRNLDSWMLDKEVVSWLFRRNARDADIAVTEGVMGLYDGYGGYSLEGSTAHVSKIIKSPVVLVVNGEGLSLSVVPIIQGFREFDKELDIRGIIINKIKSESHYMLLKQNIEEHTSISVLGYIPNMEEISLPSRHLGLIPEGEINNLKEKADILAAQIEKTVDIDLLIKISSQAVCLEDRELGFGIPEKSYKVKIAVAKDKAFNFYYKDNLDLLESMGAELVYFSPLNDLKVPEGISGLYVGGGYPEVWAKELEANADMRDSIRGLILAGLPTYAECGGLMYLSETIRDREGQIFNMVGAISGISEMTKSLKRFGYVDIEVALDNVASEEAYKVRAHEFHYSVTNVDEEIPTCYNITKTRRSGGSSIWQCGYKLHNLLAAYPHIHFWSNIRFAEKFVENCMKYKVEREI
ncbi:MAG: cobyrinate a,c-diamide synthase [Clostridia bacterium]|nr:cobyrinate a,c-diamide synthase [Clostridia bacterium]